MITFIGTLYSDETHCVIRNQNCYLVGYYVSNNYKLIDD
jgi:hypothetical protein